MLYLKASLLLFFFSATLMAAQEKPQDWTLAKEENGIRVYTRILAYSDYKEFKGEVEVQTNIDALLSFIKNTDNCPAWRYKCVKMLTLSDNYIYRLSTLPWPFSYRYTVMHTRMSYDKRHNTYTMQLQNIKREQLPEHILAQLPAQEDTVQMRYSDGFWRFKLMPEQQKIHVTYQMHGDADAALPSELTHLGIINSAFITLLNLKKHFIQMQN